MNQAMGSLLLLCVCNAKINEFWNLSTCIMRNLTNLLSFSLFMRYLLTLRFNITSLSLFLLTDECSLDCLLEVGQVYLAPLSSLTYMYILTENMSVSRDK